jgi:hypothetical protein
MNSASVNNPNVSVRCNVSWNCRQILPATFLRPLPTVGDTNPPAQSHNAQAGGTP